VLSYARHSKELQEAKMHEKEVKAKDAYYALLVKVEAIRMKNLPPEKWTSSDLGTMIQWYKRPTDEAMPSKKADKLARYLQICARGDPPVPQLTLPPPVAPMNETNLNGKQEPPPLPQLSFLPPSIIPPILPLDPSFIDNENSDTSILDDLNNDEFDFLNNAASKDDLSVLTFTLGMEV